MLWRTARNAHDLWNFRPLRIGYSHSEMTNDERMQRESSLIATIRKNLPDFAKACADDTELAGGPPLRTLQGWDSDMLAVSDS